MNADQENFADTQIEVPSLQIEDGLAYELEPPKLLSIDDFPHTLILGASGFFDICLQDDSEIVRASIDIRHSQSELLLPTRLSAIQKSAYGRQCLSIEVQTHSFHREGLYRLKRLVFVDQYDNRNVYEISNGKLEGSSFIGEIPELRLIRN